MNWKSMLTEEINAELQRYIDYYTIAHQVPPNNDQINDRVQIIVDRYNYAARSEFDGFSSLQMRRLLDDFGEENSLIRINSLSIDDLQSIPILRQVLTLCEILKNESKILLTKTGNLPPKIVRSIYDQGTPDWYIDRHITKILRESDSVSVQRVRILLKIMRVVKEQKGVMTLTKLGTKLIEDKQQLLVALIHNFCHELNWGYFDLYEDDLLGRVGFPYSLALVLKYGDSWAKASYYAEKYFRVLYPTLDVRENEVGYYQDVACYNIRTFERFLLEFGLIEMKIDNENHSFDNVLVRKNPLCDKLFTLLR